VQRVGTVFFGAEHEKKLPPDIKKKKREGKPVLSKEKNQIERKFEQSEQTHERIRTGGDGQGKGEGEKSDQWWDRPQAGTFYRRRGHSACGEVPQ